MSESGREPVRRGAIGVIEQNGQLLVIRRSQRVEAPGTYCFPGGTIEPGERPPDTVRRELLEELSVVVRPLRQLWQSVTPWNVALSWWLAELDPQALLRPNPAEVAEILWLTPRQIRGLPALLESNRQFLDAWQQGVFELDEETPSNGGC